MYIYLFVICAYVYAFNIALIRFEYNRIYFMK